MSCHTEWEAIESDMTRPTVYSGPDRDALLAALAAWTPRMGAHDPGPQIQAAQAMLGGKGTLIFVTDRRRELPSGVRLLAVGHPIDHCGFCGVDVTGGNWRALVRNYGTTTQQRHWWVEANGEKSPAQELTLAPGRTVELSGGFPPGTNRCELMMDSDHFPLDSRLPILMPKLKHLMIGVSAPPDYQDFIKQFLGSLERADVSGTTPDLTLAVYDPLNPELPKRTAIVLVTDPTPSTTFPQGNVTAMPHSLAADLNWSGLLANEGLSVPLKQDDETLVWQGARPLIFLRHDGAAQLLVVNFDIHASNAAELPAFVLLLHRFAEQVRAA